MDRLTSPTSGREVIAQAGHGFNPGQVLCLVAGDYTLASSNDLNFADWVGVVETVLDPNRFILLLPGSTSNSLAADPGVVYFLSAIGSYETPKPVGTLVNAPVLRGLPGGRVRVLEMRASEDDRGATMPIQPAPADQGGLTASEAGFTRNITEAGHGFVAKEVVYWDGANWAKAQADSAANAGDSANTGIVASVTDVNTFVLQTGGIISAAAHGFTVDEELFLSEITAGALTNTAPSTAGNVVRKYGVAPTGATIAVDIDNGYVVQ